MLSAILNVGFAAAMIKRGKGFPSRPHPKSPAKAASKLKKIREAKSRNRSRNRGIKTQQNQVSKINYIAASKVNKTKKGKWRNRIRNRDQTSLLPLFFSGDSWQKSPTKNDGGSTSPSQLNISRRPLKLFAIDATYIPRWLKTLATKKESLQKIN